MHYNNGGKKRKTGRLTNGTLIHVLVASTSYKASGTGANGTTIKRVGVTNGAFIARVTNAGIIQVAQQTCVEIKTKSIGKKLATSPNVPFPTKKQQVQCSFPIVNHGFSQSCGASNCYRDQSSAATESLRPRATNLPVFPTGHSQKKDATRSWQVAPLKQTAMAQSSMFSLQSSPVQPLTQTQV